MRRLICKGALLETLLYWLVQTGNMNCIWRNTYPITVSTQAFKLVTSWSPWQLSYLKYHHNHHHYHHYIPSLPPLPPPCLPWVPLLFTPLISTPSMISATLTVTIMMMIPTFLLLLWWWYCWWMLWLCWYSWSSSCLLCSRRAQVLAKNESYRARNLAMHASKIEL